MPTQDSPTDFRCQELGGVVLQLRPDLDVVVHELGGRTVRVLVDDLRGKFYRLGEAEYAFLSELDGHTSFALALGRVAARLRDEALSEEQAANFCRWLISHELATTESSRSLTRLREQAATVARGQWQSRWGLLYQRFPLAYPDPWLTRLQPALSWVFSLPAAFLWIALVVSGLLLLLANRERLTQEGGTFIARDNWLWLAGSIVLLKLWHELGHAAACKRFGGTVREFGVALIVFTPLPYADISGAWRIRSKWRRFATSAGGLLFELPVAAVAAWIWSTTDPGLLHQNALNVVVAAGISALVFNLNPLMKFDGYYMLTDLAEVPNLAARGQAAVARVIRRWLLGDDAPLSDSSVPRSAWELPYGLAASVWRLLVCVGLLLLASRLGYGLGVLLALAAAVSWGLPPLFRGGGWLLSQPGRWRRPASWLRLAGGIAALLLAGLGAVSLVWGRCPSAIAVVDYYPKIEVRAATSGFVEKVCAETGDWIEAGEVIVRLTNEELQAEFQRTELDVARATRRADIFLSRRETAAWQAEQEVLRAHLTRLQELQTQVDSLVVRAPRSGQVLNHSLARLAGRFLRPGDEVCTLGGTRQKELLLQISQADYEAFRSAIGQRVSVRLSGSGSARFTAELIEVAPRASRQLVHPGLGAQHGGPLEVRSTAGSNGPTQTSDEPYELSQPHFLAQAVIPLNLQPSVRSGQIGTVLLDSPTPWPHLWRRWHNWWDQRDYDTQRQWYAAEHR